MNLADKTVEIAESASLEFVLRHVQNLGTFSKERLRCVGPAKTVLGELVMGLDAEVLCQSRGNQQQTVQFWVPTSWWQHLKHTIGHRYFGIFVDFTRAPWCFGPELQGSWFKRWLGRRIVVQWKSVNKTVEWEVLDSYPKADIPVPDLGTPVRIVIPQGEVADA